MPVASCWKYTLPFGSRRSSQPLGCGELSASSAIHSRSLSARASIPRYSAYRNTSDRGFWKSPGGPSSSSVTSSALDARLAGIPMLRPPSFTFAATSCSGAGGRDWASTAYRQEPQGLRSPEPRGCAGERSGIAAAAQHLVPSARAALPLPLRVARSPSSPPHSPRAQGAPPPPGRVPPAASPPRA
eukprot:604449-Prymnesium_polylepis.2